jgi:hypothetical protein
MKRIISRPISLFLALSLATDPVLSAGSLILLRDSKTHVCDSSATCLFDQQALALFDLTSRHTLEQDKKPSSWLWRFVGKSRAAMPIAPANPDEELAKRRALQEFFIHNDGLDFASYAALMSRTGIIMFLQKEGRVSLPDIVSYLRRSHERVNDGFVDIGLRLLADAGWARIQLGDSTVTYELSEKGRFIVDRPAILQAYEKAGRFIQTELSTVEDVEQNFPFYTRPRASYPSGSIFYQDWISEAARSNSFGIEEVEGPEGQILREIKTHLWGTLLGPSAASFAYHDLFELFQKGQPISSEELKNHIVSKQSHSGLINPQRIDSALELFRAAGWMIRTGPAQREKFKITPEGALRIARAESSGVPVSYVPMFASLDALYFGPAETVFELDADGHERHVARNMNLMGTRKAHEGHFKALIPQLARLFNNTDFENQPQFIADMGCGDGSFLKLAYDYIKHHTERGKHLDAHPLWLIGADFNLKARAKTQANLEAASINEVNGRKTFHVIHGDINDWEGLKQELIRLGLDPYAGIHTSTFLIHNRPWRDPIRRGKAGDYSIGTFVAPRSEYARKGYAVANGDLDQNFLEWIEQGKPLLKRFGMFFVELHSVSAEVTASLVGLFAGLSYDATHFTSGQYTIPIPHFLNLMKEAGMVLDYFEPMPKKLGTQAPNAIYHFRAESHGVHQEQPVQREIEPQIDRTVVPASTPRRVALQTAG